MIYYPGYVMLAGYEIKERKKKHKLKLAFKNKACFISEGSLQAEGVSYLLFCKTR